MAETRPADKPIVLRAAAVLVATLAALAVWAIADLALDVDVLSPAMGDQEVDDIGPGEVIIAALGASLVGWLLLAVLERFTARAAQIWGIVALVALVISLGAPLTGEEITTANRVTLVLLHLTVGAVLIPSLYLSSRKRPGSPER